MNLAQCEGVAVTCHSFRLLEICGIMKRQLDRVLFCIAYKVVHQPFFGLKISSQVLTAFAIHLYVINNMTYIGYLSFTKHRVKHDLLQTQVLVLQLNFLNY